MILSVCASASVPSLVMSSTSFFYRIERSNVEIEKYETKSQEKPPSLDHSIVQSLRERLTESLSLRLSSNVFTPPSNQ